MTDTGRERLRNQFLGTLIFLIIQFLLGMASPSSLMPRVCS
jgi:hypothetical protein